MTGQCKKDIDLRRLKCDDAKDRNKDDDSFTPVRPLEENGDRRRSFDMYSLTTLILCFFYTESLLHSRPIWVYSRFCRQVSGGTDRPSLAVPLFTYNFAQE